MTGEAFNSKVKAMEEAIDQARDRAPLNFFEDENAQAVFATMLHVWQMKEDQLSRIATLDDQMQELQKGMDSINRFIQKHDVWYRRMLATKSFQEELADIKKDAGEIKEKVASAEEMRQEFMKEARSMFALVERAEKNWKEVAIH